MERRGLCPTRDGSFCLSPEGSRLPRELREIWAVLSDPGPTWSHWEKIPRPEGYICIFLLFALKESQYPYCPRSAVR